MTAPYPRRAYTEGPFGQIHYQTMGEGPAIVLLHQAPMTSFQFDNVYEPLARRGFKAIGIDMPGFGMSDPTSFVPRVEDFALCMVPVLDALGIDKATVLGHHTGALVANEIAIRFPERVSALIMNGPMPITDAEREDFMANGYVKEINMVAESGGDFLTRVFAARERLAAGSLPFERIGSFVIQAFMGRGKYFYGHHAAFQYRQDDALPKIAVPALILTNTGDIIYEHALRASAIRPDIPVVALDGGGVDIVDQQPEKWADAVADFLRAQAG